MARLVVSVINYRTPEMTIDCVRSVLDDIGSDDIRVVVVDNASGDGSVERLQDWIEAQSPPVPVQLIASPVNSGFSGGHNQTIRACDADFYLVLNSDTLIRPGFFRAMLAAVGTAPEAGLFAPRIETADGVAQVSFFRIPGPLSEFERAAATGPVTRLLRRWVVAIDPAQPLAPDVGWTSFACVLLRRTMIDAIGLMDEGYFLYFEDTEYSMRAGRARWRIQSVPDAVVAHFRGGSGPVDALEAARRRLPAYYYRSRARFMIQAHGRAGLLAANLLWHLGRGVAQLRRLVGKPVPVAIESEARDIWTGIFAPLPAAPGADRR
jgi:N-acetylglucosaminyl-diphospho-decaprenol L-rhamnosyltransferase